MKERPILFSGHMVRAILAGTKTQTRRVVVPQFTDRWGSGIALAGSGLPVRAGVFHVHARVAGVDRFIYCPYGVPGDRLWVRETWRSWKEDCDDGSGASHGFDTPCGPHCRQVYVAYAATPREGYRPEPDKAAITYLDASTPLDRYHESLTGPWRPSIFMPRWASRVTIELTEVRVQRLQEISEDDARAEGFSTDPMPGTVNGEPATLHFFEPRAWYSAIWDAINAKRGFSWLANPWVWALTFRRAE